MKYLFLMLILLLSSGNASSSPPNILFIAVDDMNDWVEGFGGHPDTITPNISELASRGVSFLNAHASSVSCNPSRTSLLLGLAPKNTGVLSNSQTPMRDYTGNHVETIFQYFQRYGYYVAGTGKLFHTNDQSEPWSEHENFTWKRGQPLVKPYHGLPELSEGYNSWDWGPGEGLDSTWGDYQIASYGENFLEQPHTQPFFLALGFTLPHLPWYVPHEYWNRFPEEPSLPPYLPNDRADMPRRPQKFSTDIHRIVTEGNKWNEGIRGYLASINFTDNQVGRVLAALDNSQYSGNTIIVFWSDHGFHLGEKDAWSKFTLWEETTRVPLIIVAPNLTQANTESTKTVSLLESPIGDP